MPFIFMGRIGLTEWQAEITGAGNTVDEQLQSRLQGRSWWDDVNNLSHTADDHADHGVNEPCMGSEAL